MLNENTHFKISYYRNTQTEIGEFENTQLKKYLQKYIVKYRNMLIQKYTV